MNAFANEIEIVAANAFAHEIEIENAIANQHVIANVIAFVIRAPPPRRKIFSKPHGSGVRG